MKSTRSFNLAKVVLLAVLAAGFSASLASAQELRAKFTLPFEARWGKAILPPGEYSINLDAGKPPYMALVQQGQQGVALVMAAGQTNQREVTGPSTLIAVRSGGTYRIRELRLAEVGIVLEYNAPKAERRILAQTPRLIRRVPVLLAAK